MDCACLCTFGFVCLKLLLTKRWVSTIEDLDVILGVLGLAFWLSLMSIQPMMMTTSYSYVRVGC